MARNHYHVLQGLRGCYMPNTNDVYRTKREAQSGAAWWAENARDEGERVVGSARSGFYEVGDHCSIEVTDCDSEMCLCSPCGGTGELPGGWNVGIDDGTTAPCGDCGGEGFPLA